MNVSLCTILNSLSYIFIENKYKRIIIIFCNKDIFNIYQILHCFCQNFQELKINCIEIVQINIFNVQFLIT